MFFPAMLLLLNEVCKVSVTLDLAPSASQKRAAKEDSQQHLLASVAHEGTEKRRGNIHTPMHTQTVLFRSKGPQTKPLKVFPGFEHNETLRPTPFSWDTLCIRARARENVICFLHARKK